MLLLFSLIASTTLAQPWLYHLHDVSRGHRSRTLRATVDNHDGVLQLTSLVVEVADSPSLGLREPQNLTKNDASPLPLFEGSEPISAEATFTDMEELKVSLRGENLVVRRVVEPVTEYTFQEEGFGVELSFTMNHWLKQVTVWFEGTRYFYRQTLPNTLTLTDGTGVIVPLKTSASDAYLVISITYDSSKSENPVKLELKRGVQASRSVIVDIKPPPDVPTRRSRKRDSPSPVSETGGGNNRSDRSSPNLRGSDSDDEAPDPPPRPMRLHGLPKGEGEEEAKKPSPIPVKRGSNQRHGAW